MVLDFDTAQKSGGELLDDHQILQLGPKTSKMTLRCDENSDNSDVDVDDQISTKESTSKENDVSAFVENSNIPYNEVQHNTSYVAEDSSRVEEDDNHVSDDDDLEKLLGSGQEGTEFDGQDIKLLGSEDSIHTISTGEVEEAVKVIDTEDYTPNIEEGFADNSEKLTEDSLKSLKTIHTSGSMIPIPPDGFSMVNFSKSSETIEILTSPDSAADNSNMNIIECLVDPSAAQYEETLQSQSIEVIPPDGTIMVDFKKSTPVKVTIDVRPNDSVSAKLKQITSIASDYVNTLKLAQDLIKAQNMSVQYRTDGETIGVTQISASLSNTDCEEGHHYKLNKTTGFQMHTPPGADPNKFEDDYWEILMIQRVMI